MLAKIILPTTPVGDLPHVSTDATKRLARLGCGTLEDLLYHFPVRFDDFSHIYTIDAIERDWHVTLAGIVHNLRTSRSWKKNMMVTSATLHDRTGTLRLVWFNDRYVGTSLSDGMAIRVSGIVGADFDGLLLTNPVFERATRPPVNTARMVPIYRETAGVTSRWLRWQLDTLLHGASILPEIIPTDIRDALRLPDRATALRYVHFPRTEKHLQLAQKYFAFEEMFLVQLHSLRIKRQWHGKRAVAVPDAAMHVRAWVATLPFVLTPAQKRAVLAIAKDLSTHQPMHRLLNGDVGSGKTVVAGAATAALIAAGYQVAIVAPTEMLARQHYASFQKFFPEHTAHCALMTGATKMLGAHKASRTAMLHALSSGDARIIIGTHALIGDDVHYGNLALVVIDEQHRFGVAQRAAMQQKTAQMDDGRARTIPHFLTMTATPIPRSLALAFFGDVDLSVLEDMPAGRKPIKTTVVGSIERERTYAHIRDELAAGRQAYVILPLVETSGKESLAHVKAATEEAAILQKTVFHHYRVGLVHGRMKTTEKDTIMQQFRNGHLHVLVATAVVEVGVDVPNASVMIIEGAERFGLSQLHQFRGRIGRGTHQSFCFLFASRTIDPPPERLRIMAQKSSGFAIAEEDLALRGAGQFFGTRQSGIPDIAMANITNVRLIEHARSHAAAVLDDDPSLAHHPALRAALRKFENTIHME